MDKLYKKSFMNELLPDCVNKGRPYEMCYKGKIPFHKVPYLNSTYALNPTDLICVALKGKKGSKFAYNYLQKSISERGIMHHIYNIPWYGGIKAPWIGGLTQALAVLLFLKKGNRKLACKAGTAMVNKCFKDGIIHEKPGVCILNGWLYGIIALEELVKAGYLQFYPYYQIALGRLTAEFDWWKIPGGWYRYDETGIPCTPFYQQLTFDLLFHVGTYFADDIGFNVMRFPFYLSSGKEPKLLRLLYIVKKHHIKIFAVYIKRRRWLRD